MVELMEQLYGTAADGEPAPPELLQAIGHALLMGAQWETVLNDGRWAFRSLYIAYTHDKLGTPDNVEGVFFERSEAEALVSRVAQGQSASHPLHQQFYKFKVAEWPLGALAIREARDGFHRGVITHVVMQIKAALRQAGKLPQGVAVVSVGPAGALNEALVAYIDVTGQRIVLWEDCCFLAGAGESIDFTTRARTPLCGLMNGHGEIIVPPAFQQVAPLCNGLAVAKRRGKYGYIDATGNMVISFAYEDALDSCQDLLLVKSGGLWGAIDLDGNEVIPALFDALEHDLGNEALRAKRDGKHGYLSLSGDLLAGYSEQALHLAEQSFATERSVFIAHDTSLPESRHVLVDVQGCRIGMQSFTDIQYSFQDEGLLCASVQEGQRVRFGYIGLHGEIAIDFRFVAAESFSEGLAAVITEESGARHYGYIDRQGNWAIAPMFEHAGEFHQGLAAACGKAHHPWHRRLVDQAWAERIEGAWHRLLEQALGPAWHQPATPTQPRRYGYIDRKGQWVIDPYYLEAKPFNEGLAPVRLEQGWGYIDINGTHVTPSFYQEAGPFKQGVARVGRRFDGPLRYGLVDIHGREIIPLRFDWLSYPKRGLITACDEYGLWGCFTLFGNIVAPFIYREAHDLHVALAARGTRPH